VLAIALPALIPVARADAQAAAPPAASVRLEVDNDVFVLRGSGPPPDYDYTHGTRIAVIWPGAPARLGRASGADPRCASMATERPCLLSSVGLGQEIYTPRHNAPTPIAGDRPHAAWLYGAAALERLTALTLQTLQLRAGVTGPAALGGATQNEMHRLLHNKPAVGWQAQIPTHLAIGAQYDATRLVARRASPGPSRFVSGTVGATAGTQRLTMRAAAAAYYGFGEVGTWSTASPLVARPGRFHVAAGYEQSVVVHDAFIEGLGATKGASLIPWVGEAYGAVGVRIGRMEGEYRYVWRSREYRAEPDGHPYAAIVVSLVRH
jgi:lipid A 3-O-deacylase